MTNTTRRREYSGSATPQTLVADMTASSTSATIDGASNWPLGTVGPFVVTLDITKPNEEKVLVSSRSGTTLTILSRGYDGTSAYSHVAGASANHTESAVDFNEANAHSSATSGVHGMFGNLVDDSTAQTVDSKTLTNATIPDFSRANHAHVDSASGGVLNFLATPAQTLRAHLGTASLSPGGTTVSFPHGSPFTPVTGFISGTANVPFTSIVITSYDATNMSVAFYGAGSNSPLSIGTCALSFVVFG